MKKMMKKGAVICASALLLASLPMSAFAAEKAIYPDIMAGMTGFAIRGLSVPKNLMDVLEIKEVTFSVDETNLSGGTDEVELTVMKYSNPAIEPVVTTSASPNNELPENEALENEADTNQSQPDNSTWNQGYNPICNTEGPCGGTYNCPYPDGQGNGNGNGNGWGQGQGRRNGGCRMNKY